MPLEPVTNYIDDLEESWPIGNIDTLDEADNHLRGIKNAVKGSFPNLGQSAVTLTADEINQLAPDRDEALLGNNPVGAVIMFNAAFATIPANWQLCDGTNGTPNMVDKFVYGTNTEVQVGATGGTADGTLGSHTHTRGTMNITGTFGPVKVSGTNNPASYATGAFSRTNITFDGDGGESRTGMDVTYNAASAWTGNTSSAGGSLSGVNIPPYVKLAYIQRMS